MKQIGLNSELLDYFIEYLRRDHSKAEGTINNIQRDIKYFISYLDEHNLDITLQSVQNYLQILEDKYTESSYISKASSLRQFINWLNLDDNPFWKIRISINLEDYKYYEKEELAGEFSKSDYPNLIIRSLYELYLSIEELCGLKLCDYNTAGQFFVLREHKIKVSDDLANALKHYLKQLRPNLLAANFATTSNDPFFIKATVGNTSLEEISANDVHKILQEKNLKNSYLKRSRIIHLIEDGKTPDDIEQILGIKISEFYRPFFKEKSYRLLSAYKEFHPRARVH